MEKDKSEGTVDNKKMADNSRISKSGNNETGEAVPQPEGGDEEKSLHEILNTSYLDSDPSNDTWKLVNLKTNNNKVLLDKFQNRVEELKNLPNSNTESHYGYMVECDDNALREFLTHGLTVGHVTQNTIGYGRCGVYLTSHIDVCIKYFACRFPNISKIKIVVIKYVTGRLTRCVPKAAYATEIIQPTQGFDCHVSVIPPSCNDPIHVQYERDQVYLYELDDQNIPRASPRHCVPIAVATYDRDNDLAANSNKLLSAYDLDDSGSQCSNDSSGGSARGYDRFANNPDLKAIVDTINTRTPDRAPMLPRRKRTSQLESLTSEAQSANQDRFAKFPELKAIVDQINARPSWENAPMLPPRKPMPPGACNYNYNYHHQAAQSHDHSYHDNNRSNYHGSHDNRGGHHQGGVTTHSGQKKYSNQEYGDVNRQSYSSPVYGGEKGQRNVPRDSKHQTGYPSHVYSDDWCHNNQRSHSEGYWEGYPIRGKGYMYRGANTPCKQPNRGQHYQNGRHSHYGQFS